MPAVNQYAGKIVEFRLAPGGQQAIRIGCPPEAIPRPGQYLLADSPSDDESILSSVLFPQQILNDGLLAAPPERRFPDPDWTLGSTLLLRGPLGKGFQLPGVLRNLALAACGDSAARLLPLFKAAGSVALFTDAPLPDLPLEVESQPLAGLPDALSWADFVALDLPFPAGSGLDIQGCLRNILGLDEGKPFPAAGQVLIAGPMPCGGIGDCSVCAVSTRHGYRLACKDGPVFPLGELIE